MNDTKAERIFLIGLAALSLVIVGILGVGALRSDKIDAVAAGIIGAIATGLLTFANSIIQAIRSFSTGAQLGKVTDQLAQAGPVTPDSVPKDAKAAADVVADAAVDAADTIKG